MISINLKDSKTHQIPTNILFTGNLAHSASVSSDISNRTKMDIVCVIDVVQTSNLSHRKRALEEVRQASMLVNANLSIISVITIIICI